MTDARVKEFYDKIVKAGIIKADLDYLQVLHDPIRLQEGRHGPEEIGPRAAAETASLQS